MNCSTIEKWIYLFDELGEEDRARVNRHIASCLACQKLYQMVRSEKDILRRTLATTPDITNHARLTSSIMSAIHREDNPRSSVFGVAAWYLLSKPMQYSLLTLSLFLGIFFFMQYNQSNRLPTGGPNTYSNQTAATVDLNSTLFYQEFNRAKQSGISTASFSIRQCLQACQKLSAHACFACKSKLTKLNKQYETI